MLARDRVRGKVLLGGLGGMSMGQMWMDDEPHYAKYKGYLTAVDRCSDKSNGLNERVK